MFTGIIQTTGELAKIQRTKVGRFITIKTNSKIVRAIPEGGSVSIDGVCLTALDRKGDTLRFELMDSTLRRTTLGALKEGAEVNVEPAMRASDAVGGHFVSGHVDGVGTVKQVRIRWHTRYVEIQVPKNLVQYLVAQGSIVVNGVSLTIVEVGDRWFSVALTSYTIKHTNLSGLRVGMKVNIEVDMLAKYLRNFLATSH